MAWTLTELAEIEAAYKSGVKKVKFKDRETEFRDLAEMKNIINEAKVELNQRSRAPYAPTYGRGYQ